MDVQALIKFKTACPPPLLGPSEYWLLEKGQPCWIKKEAEITSKMLTSQKAVGSNPGAGKWLFLS